MKKHYENIKLSLVFVFLSLVSILFYLSFQYTKTINKPVPSNNPIVELSNQEIGEDDEDDFVKSNTVSEKRSEIPEIDGWLKHVDDQFGFSVQYPPELNLIIEETSFDSGKKYSFCYGRYQGTNSSYNAACPDGGVIIYLNSVVAPPVILESDISVNFLGTEQKFLGNIIRENPLFADYYYLFFDSNSNEYLLISIVTDNFSYEDNFKLIESFTIPK